jgi:peptidoglycan/xylan/chitin deacetylase (PgdA/CDA1 family)/glycosyltransferase involved in cell wall biosynthesis
VRAPGDVAVVIPCFNLGAWLPETLASVVAQTRPAREIVVIDDGSDDPDTIAVLDRVPELTGGRARTERTPHQGVALARDHGCRTTSAPYLLWLDADDLVDRSFLEKTASLLDADPTLDFVATGTELFGDASGAWVPPPPDDLLRHLADGSYSITTLFRRRLWEAIGGCDSSLEAAEDWDFWLRALERGHAGAVVEEPLFRYRIRRGSRDERGLVRTRFARAIRTVLERRAELVGRLGGELIEKRRGHLRHRVREREELLATESRLQGTLDRLLREVEAAEAETAPPSGAGRGAGPTPLRRRAPGAAILCYHRLAELAPDPFDLCTPPAVFRAHMQHLVRSCQPMALEELARALDSGEAPERAVAVTFDDGYRDALDASRILLELGIPATFFVNSERIDEPHEAWQEVLERIFLSELPIPPRLELRLGDAPLVLPSAGEARRAAFQALYHVGRALSPLGREGLIEQISAWSRQDLSPRDSHRVLVASELRELAARPGHCVGSHTVHHLLLPAHAAALQRAEIVDDKETLERILGRPVTVFAYPYGERNRETIELARQAGFACGVSTRPGLVRPWDDPLDLPRNEIGALAVEELAARLDRLFV